MSNATDHPWDHINPGGFPTPQLPNQGYRVWIALVVMIVSSGLFVAARVATRIVHRQMGNDDYVILGSLGSFLVQTTLWALSVRTGYGADYMKLNRYYQREFNKWWFLGSIFWLTTLTQYKISVILLLKRIFVQRGFQIACWCVLVVTSCWGLGNVLGWIFQCLPIPSMWGMVEAERCFNMAGLWISITSWDISSDVCILIMPIPMIWKLNLKAGQKIMVTGVFLLGAVVVVFSLMSCSAIVSSLQQEQGGGNYTFALANLFQVLESGMGIIGACLPIMRQPLAHIFPGLLKSWGSKRTPRYYDDPDSEPHVLQDFSGRQDLKQKSGATATWHSVSASGPDRFKVSAPRGSDEFRMIEGSEPTQQWDSREDIYALPDSKQTGIRKDVRYNIQRESMQR